MLATTLEPVRHRDYTVAATHHYPTTPLKKINDTKQGKKKKKVTRKKSKKDNSTYMKSLNQDGTLAGADTPESFIDSSREADIRKGQQELQAKLGEGRLSTIRQEITGELTPTDATHSVSDYAESLASRILKESIPKTVTVFDPADLYAQDLASSIMQQALDTVEMYMVAREKSMLEKMEQKRLPPHSLNTADDADNKENGKEILIPKGIRPEVPKNVVTGETSTDITEKPVDMSVLDKYRK